jgi:hypothetical protein
MRHTPTQPVQLCHDSSPRKRGVLHPRCQEGAGHELEFVPNALLTFKSQARTWDYCGEMNFNNFLQRP